MGKRRIRALGLLTAIALAGVGCGSNTPGTPSAAGDRPSSATTTTSRVPFEGDELADGEVVQVEKVDGVRLESPDDGRLRSHGVAVEVLDFGTADVVDGGAGVSYGARPDSTLLAFRLRVTPYREDADEKVTATVSVDGRQRSLPEFEYTMSTVADDTTASYVVAVPDDRREVELELKYAGLAQTFDLLDGRRTGDQPEVLYRSPDTPSVHVENLTPAKLAVADEEGTPGAYVVAVTRAELTYFTTELGDVPSTKDKAWLVITYEPGGEGSLDHGPEPTGCTVPFAAFSLADGKGGTYPVIDKHSSMEEFDDVKTLVFEVPADLTDATLTVAPPSFTCASAGLEYPFTVAAPTTVEMTLPED